MRFQFFSVSLGITQVLLLTHSFSPPMSSTPIIANDDGNVHSIAITNVCNSGVSFVAAFPRERHILTRAAHLIHMLCHNVGVFDTYHLPCKMEVDVSHFEIHLDAPDSSPDSRRCYPLWPAANEEEQRKRDAEIAKDAAEYPRMRGCRRCNHFDCLYRRHFVYRDVTEFMEFFTNRIICQQAEWMQMQYVKELPTRVYVAIMSYVMGYVDKMPFSWKPMKQRLDCSTYTMLKPLFSTPLPPYEIRPALIENEKYFTEDADENSYRRDNHTQVVSEKCVRFLTKKRKRTNTKTAKKESVSEATDEMRSRLAREINLAAERLSEVAKHISILPHNTEKMETSSSYLFTKRLESVAYSARSLSSDVRFNMYDEEEEDEEEEPNNQTEPTVAATVEEDEAEAEPAAKRVKTAGEFIDEALDV